MLEPVPADIGHEKGYSLNRSSVHGSWHIETNNHSSLHLQTTGNIEPLINLHVFKFWVEAEKPRGGQHRDAENMSASQRKAPVSL